MLRLNNLLSELRGVGKVRFGDLQREGLKTIEDLLLYAPIRYEDRTCWKKLATLELERPCLVCARVSKLRFYTAWRRRMRILQVEVRDETGVAHLVFYNQPYLAKTFVTGALFYIFGAPKISERGGKTPVFYQPDFERCEEDSEDPVHMGHIVPVYRRIGSCSSRMLRSLVHSVLFDLGDWPPDSLPQALSERYGLQQRSQAIVALHFPQALISGGFSSDSVGAAALPWRKAQGDSPGAASDNTPEEGAATGGEASQLLLAAGRRLKFEEMFHFYLGLLDRKAQIQRSSKSHPIRITRELEEVSARLLPFPLTDAQRRVVREIFQDMSSTQPMCRLLQGDVGSGKTVVALLAVLAAVVNGKQSALMTPTEVLAEQHFLTFERWLHSTPYRVACVTSQVAASERVSIARGLQSGQISLAVGTQALIQQSTQFKDLGLAVIDEQHRFGVLQRVRLGDKGNQSDILAMTATPIPRSLALTLYGDLDVSVLDELPPGRLPVRTIHCRGSGRSAVYERIRQQVSRGRQVYFVCPLVQASSRAEVRDVERSYQKLAREVFPDLSVELLHGRLPSEQKLRILTEFQSGAVLVLVCTTVIEVGIDVPNATLMVIENAERFGIAQLHQLRGRVGRATEAGECVLMTGGGADDEALERIRVLCETNDGFRIAEEDLRKRGPGEFAGVRQSGLPNFRFIDLVGDRDLLERARCEAREFFNSSQAATAEGERIIAHSRRLWDDGFGFLSAG